MPTASTFRVSATCSAPESFFFSSRKPSSPAYAPPATRRCAGTAGQAQADPGRAPEPSGARRRQLQPPCVVCAPALRLRLNPLTFLRLRPAFTGDGQRPATEGGRAAGDVQPRGGWAGERPAGRLSSGGAFPNRRSVSQPAERFPAGSSSSRRPDWSPLIWPPPPLAGQRNVAAVCALGSHPVASRGQLSLRRYCLFLLRRHGKETSKCVSRTRSLRGGATL